MLLPLAVEARSSYAEPIVNGRLQAKANCIQCAGRFLCGHTDQVVKLKYMRTYKDQSIKAHCSQMSHEVKESIRTNGGEPRSEEAVRYKDYFEQFVAKIQKNKGGKLSYKEEKGFPFSDFVFYTLPTSKVSKTTKAKNIKKAKKTLRTMRKENVVLPVVSIEDYKQHMSAASKSGRLDVEYQNYVKNLLVLHPSELEEASVGTGIYIKGLTPNTALKNKMAKAFGERATQNQLGGSGSAGTRVAGKSGGNSQARMPSNIGSGDKTKSDANVQYDENFKIINTEKQQKKARDAARKTSSTLLKTSLNEQKAKTDRQSWLKGTSPDSKPYFRDTTTGYNALKTLFSTGSNSPCGQGNTKSARSFASSASSAIIKDYGTGVDTTLSRTQATDELQAQIQDALNSGNSDNCLSDLRMNFSNPDKNRMVASVTKDSQSAEVEVEEERKLLAASSDRASDFQPEISVASVSKPNSGSAPSSSNEAGSASPSTNQASPAEISSFITGVESSGTSILAEAGAARLQNKLESAITKDGTYSSSGRTSAKPTVRNKPKVSFQFGHTGNQNIKCTEWKNTLNRVSQSESLYCEDKSYLSTCAKNWRTNFLKSCNKLKILKKPTFSNCSNMLSTLSNNNLIYDKTLETQKLYSLENTTSGDEPKNVLSVYERVSRLKSVKKELKGLSLKFLGKNNLVMNLPQDIPFKDLFEKNQLGEKHLCNIIIESKSILKSKKLNGFSKKENKAFFKLFSGTSFEKIINSKKDGELNSRDLRKLCAMAPQVITSYGADVKYIDNGNQKIVDGALYHLHASHGKNRNISKMRFKDKHRRNLAKFYALGSYLYDGKNKLFYDKQLGNNIGTITKISSPTCLQQNADKTAAN